MSHSIKENSGDNNMPIYLDPDRPLEERVEDLVSRLTLEEKSFSDDFLLRRPFPA